MTVQVPHALPAAETRAGRCPRCGQQSRFRFLGEQRWSARVARAAGLPAVMRLYICDVCSTTISERDLDL